MGIFVNSRNYTPEMVCEIMRLSISGLNYTLRKQTLKIQDELGKEVMSMKFYGSYLKITSHRDIERRESYDLAIKNLELEIAPHEIEIIMELADPFSAAKGIDLEIVNKFNAVLTNEGQTILRLRLWKSSEGNALEIQPFEHGISSQINDMIHQYLGSYNEVKVFTSGSLIKYIVDIL
ncbi:hypothetical protein [Pedobacter aquatilis]|uniref:hypothetical protein n=1 Tax=Pedobacter aquatilis TaxID=351343 RepID=UPI0029309233|nr:hypothetical protein [Pedobacter aquatilis]